MARTYDRKFKVEAVRMASEPGVTAQEVERRLGIGQGVMARLSRTAFIKVSLHTGAVFAKMPVHGLSR